ncbi:P-loop containing nucleoside triphosphate hydrolase protein [Schizophyllum commune H4-8]|uniref:P-loop containing nucleoside triphosphate hydrolase protein n=1 Tax=Schizophyllum commune (strain H4-8 / FGSC 9210) TaxID=578458 RepID=UPI00216108A9|nr:P-loop containing nucleoside triphosphate hydrolase protein [Schizophyllum commune H4-8]KAI5898014.1 P-loop containing nucleoside triphosphate hydrolase protein [Schizophyllum commune H4-8]
MAPNKRRQPGTGKGRKNNAKGKGSQEKEIKKKTQTEPWRLESSFIRLSPEFLEITKKRASDTPLPRPIPASHAIFPSEQSSADGYVSCLRRPKWRYDQTKTEVEKNEEALFRKWLAEADEKINGFADASDVLRADGPIRSPCYYERNLEVWRQLWRVTEISDIILVLLDSRCPLIHFPDSLSRYLASYEDKRVILVLTKVDITGTDRTSAWKDYISTKHPGLRIVEVESYAEKAYSATGRRPAYEPHLPEEFRRRLVEAIRDTHTELLQPPPRVRESAKRLAHWKPSVKRSVDWEAAAAPREFGAPEPVRSAPPKPENDAEGTEEPPFLTIGLIGQPNVGKSSLLNALFGASKVRASKTPGKTKHYQTLFLSPDIRLVDCPGLVLPSHHEMEAQVLAGILPISRVSAVPACIHHAARLLPLERILDLKHPSAAAPLVEDKRTWRAGTGPKVEQRTPRWTAIDILIAYAEKKGWLTAKAGRPDVHRAGNAILRMLAEGRIRWGYWPPGSDESVIRTVAGVEGAGIWIPGQDVIDEEEDDEPEELEGDERAGKKHEDSAEDAEKARGGVEKAEDGAETAESESESDDEPAIQVTGGRFGALNMLDEGGEEEESE